MATAAATAALLLFSTLVGLVDGLADTDTITWGGDNSRAGYQTNHNMDPAVVGSDQFAQIFKTALPGNYNGAPEQIFSQPLVYTPSGGDGTQYVYFATTQNNVYKLNAKTGVIVASRNLAIPFLTADLNGCVDINPLVGITATGVIDPATDTLYLTLKTYANQQGGNGAQGKPNGRYWLIALNVNDLTDRPNFPVDIEGTLARNNPTRSFNGGIQHQRPALLHSGQYIYAGFASHCVQYNFTGWIIGWDKTTGKIVERYAMEGEGVLSPTKGGGVWMSGGGLASDDQGSMFFATGNGYASQLSTIPVNGRNPPTALEEAAVHMTINGDGSLTIVDFFMPFDKQALDGGDRDLGTSPLEILPSDVFSCGDVKRIGVVTGKEGKTYWLNLDDLGGYKNTPDFGDKVLQTYQNENSVYAGAGVYPLEGGYIYINVIQYPSHVFKFSCNNGVPSFAKVADSPVANAYTLGVSHGTVTSLNGQPGTGLLWISDVQGYNLRIYNAVPQNGLLTLVNQFSVPGTTKFTRPVFGDGIVYQGTTQGFVYGFGAPTNPALNCTTPVNFGSVDIGASAAQQTVTCKAKIAVTVTSVDLANSSDYSISGVPATLPLQLAAGASFTFQATFKPSTVGLLTGSVSVATTNGAATGYSVKTPIRLTGTGASQGPLFKIDPNKVAFTQIVTGTDGGSDETVFFINQGNTSLTLSSVMASPNGASGTFTPITVTNGQATSGPFTLKNLPTTIAANSQSNVDINFNPTTGGNYSLYLQVNSTGGPQSLSVTASSGPAPVALLEFQTPDGTGWVKYESGKNFTFGNVTENQTRSLKLRLTNNGGTGAVPLQIAVSKPPFGVAGSIIGANNQVDLAEGTIVRAGESAYATLYCSVPKEQWNTDPYYGNAQWTMNLNDPTWGKQFIQFDCGAVSEQAPPLQANGLGRYRYTGCFKENNPGRQLAYQLYSSSNNTGAMCIAACAAKGYAYCGTQYNSECWGGPNIPVQQVSEDNCNYPCAGDVNQICGGNGVNDGAGGSYISLFHDINGGSTPVNPGGPVTNPGVNGYGFLGCYTEATGARALVNGMPNPNKTVAGCIASCNPQYKYAGVEYGGECWCGNSFSAGSVVAPITDCNMICNGNATEYCGAGNRLDVYVRGGVGNSTSTSSSSTASSTSSTATGTGSTSTTSTSSAASPTATGPYRRQTVGPYQFQGCWTETNNGRALYATTYADDGMTLDSCAAFCSAYTYFGVEYGRECYCGNTLRDGSTLATLSDCSFLCPGDKTEYCGAGNRLELYKKGAAVSNSTSSATSSTVTSSTITSPVSSPTVASTATSTSSSSSSASPTATGPWHRPTVAAYQFQGCWTETLNGRALYSTTYANDSMTLDSCAAFCAAYTYFGVEYGRECYCGNVLRDGSALAPLSDCWFLCPGDNTEYCGAGDRLELYKKGNGTNFACVVL
ncbi:uncharacterized protein E0L32_007777 [Thyridium curvatum]|uniref:WSC domain-containing protein n=1 Tax=Thyridium curvatum TaxID=1093900 RepID=A0A507AXT7_9PEZI|nr:uncharacterized protein E0L32_007777 [Thyridium curvatum]TPX11566.1 hypothetical protein E0L32_007777 [Thyridium curvatum]